jgi:hypothetical protein
MTLGELVAILGEPDSKTAFQRLITYRYVSPGLEVQLTSSDPSVATEDATVCAVVTMPMVNLIGGLLHGLEQDEVEAQLGVPMIASRGVHHFTSQGVAVQYDEEQRVEAYAVWPAYESVLEPPEMLPAQTAMPSSPANSGDGMGDSLRYEFDGQLYEVVDMHLHTGLSSAQQPDGIAFLLSQLPSAALMSFPVIAGLVTNPYAAHLGIKEHLGAAGVAHGVLLAAYTHHTVGYAENRLLEEILDDPRNVNADGTQWSWGLASINFDDFEDPSISQSRLEALNSYFVDRPDLFIGIKLAHAHQAVAFDDPTYLGVYDIAAEHGVPLLLHTGFSPFPNTMSDPHYYDPMSLAAVIQAYDGFNGAPRVDFVLAHAGQGDARAIEHSLQLAAEHDNVWLELSAINRPLLIDADGQEVDDPTLMHPYVLSEIKERGLVHKAIFATDGPQYFGKEQSYLQLLASTMKSSGYTTDDLASVFSGNFYECFHPPEQSGDSRLRPQD